MAFQSGLLSGASCFLLCCVLCQAGGVSEPKVNILQGTVVGSAENDYYQFYGIPYADSTSGINRFKVFIAYLNYGVMCSGIIL